MNMDMERFDALSRRLAEALTRRGVTRIAAIAAAAALPALAPRGRLTDVVARKKKKRKKKRRKKPPAPPPPPPPCGGNCGAAYPQCCPATTQDPQGFCTLPEDVCCTSAQGGGACPESLPKCCPPTTQFENGLCGDPDDTCCPSNKGGFLCPPGLACCANSADCPQGSACEDNCCLSNSGVQSRSARPNHDVRRRR
jgi:hypothetical protein